MTEQEARAAARAQTRAAARQRVDDGDPFASPLERMLEGSLLAGRPAETVAAAPPAADPVVRRRDWIRRYAFLTLCADALLLMIASCTAYAVRFGDTGGSVGGLSYLAVTVVVVPVWLLFLAASRCYEGRYLGVGVEEIRRAFNASVRLVAAAGLLALAAQVQVSRSYVVIGLVVGTALLVLQRVIAHRILMSLRRRGHCLTRVVAVGDRKRILELVDQARREPDSGFTVIGACTALGSGEGRTLAGVPVLGSLTQIVQVVNAVGADTVAVTAGTGINATTLRRLGWELEGSGVTLVVAPGLTDVAGPRIQVRPVGSRLPLLEVDEPEFTGVRKVLKEVQDRLLASVLVALLSPVLLLVALLVRLDSRGPALFRQTRVGRYGREFVVLKFRTMHVGAEAQLPALAGANQSDGLLFKLKADPRVTRVGRVLRRYSLDELPQLFNVLLGSMALVGPRPPLPQEVAGYSGDVRRRLLVKPGMTGLWQVGGRSDLSWEDTVRLDLFYVENWSLPLDLSILVKTVRAVVKGSGAY